MGPLRAASGHADPVDAGQAGSGRQRALRYRDGLLIAFLAARPLRRRNLAALRLGHSLRRHGPDWWIDIPAGETKTGAPIRMPVPPAITAAIDCYLAEHRPVLAGGRGRWWRAAGDALWLSVQGSPMTEMALYDRVVRITRAALGRPLNPHLFRDCAATAIATDDPDHVRIAAPLLGHSTLATTERHYNQARGRQAALRWQAHMLMLRQQPPSGGAAASEASSTFSSTGILENDDDAVIDP
ncbi:MAG: tyrosine-type recombinase/integrase [Porticoccaceae bacterium]